MAKLPKYMKIEYDSKKRNFNLIIKRWGFPHLIYKTLKENFELKWYQWFILYPYACIKVMSR